MKFLRTFPLILGTVLTLAWSTSGYGQEPIKRIPNPPEVAAEMVAKPPKEFEGLQWNRWTSKNFVVCSLNDTQAQYLHKHLELVKSWIYARWGLFDVDFSKECKLICVDNPELFNKLFGLNQTKVEIRRDESGKIKETIIFILLNGPPSRTVPVPLTEVCLAEFGQKYNSQFALWGVRGMSTLNGSLEQIRTCMADVKGVLDKDEPLFFSKGIMEMTPDQYAKLSVERRRLYNDCATLFCLMVRKEFGQDSYLRVLKASSEGKSENGLQVVLKFKDYYDFDKSLKRYIVDITTQFSKGKVPDSYLQIKENK